MKCATPGCGCPVDAALSLIGGKYKPMILWHLVGATLRYSALQKLVPRATPKMLTQQLRELEKDGLLSRTVYAVVPPKVEYSLTDLGHSLKPLLSLLYDWGENYLKANGVEANCAMAETRELLR